MPNPKIERDVIRGKVAAIVSNRAIAINRGADDGVAVGTRFAVLYQDSTDLVVTDPDTGNELGYVDIPKVIVKVFRVVGPHLAVARTYRSIPGKPGKPGPFSVSTMDFLGGARPTPDRYETLEISDEDRMDRKIDPGESYVEVGDPVVEVRGDEYDGYSEFR